MLRFPRLGPPERRSPALSVQSEHYDFLRRRRGRLYPSLPRSHRSSPRSLPCGGDFRSGLVPLKPGTAGYYRQVEHRISQVPGESIPYLCPVLRSRPVHRPSPFRYDDAVPKFWTLKTPARIMSRLNHAASISAAYASSDALPHPHARLASGRWLAFAGWESNPLDSIEKFPSVTSNFLHSQVYPGATKKNIGRCGRPRTYEHAA
jgi:hypothetical protein